MTLPYLAGTAVGPGAGDVFFLALDAQLIAQGWVVIDTINNTVGNRRKIYKGAALDATADNRPYIDVKCLTADSSLHIRTWTDWDTGTHAGIGDAGNISGSTQIALQDATFNYWMRINGVSVAIATKIGASYNKNYWGFTRRHLQTIKGGVTKSSGAITAGAATVNVASDMTAQLKPGQWVHIFNYGHSSASANKLHKELIQIQSILAGSITFQTAVAKNYDSGALIGYNPLPHVAGQSTTSSTQGLGAAFMAFTLADGDVSSGGTNYSLSQLAVMDQQSTVYGGPERPSTEYQGGYYFFYDSGNVTNSQSGWGTLYHWEITLGQFQANEDMMDDGKYQYQLFNVNTNGNTAMLGPTNV